LAALNPFYFAGTMTNQMKRILVPCDFSPTAEQAYAFALDLAKRTDGEIFVLRVIDIPFMYESYSPTMPAFLNLEVWDKLVADSTENFRKMKSSHGQQADVTFRVIEGPTTLTILDFIEKEKIDLVVMGTKGASGLDEVIIGSNTEKIVQLAKVPVLAISKAVNFDSIRKIVVPTTLELDQPGFVNKVKELQKLFRATLHLLAINTPYNAKRSKYVYRDLEDYAKHYQLSDCTLHIREDFDEQAGILGFMDDIHGDMIAMATHGRRGLAHLFVGSITEHVVNHTHFPIWTYSIRKVKLQE
jgi:nucleotide-binding universal stress UspA family protein